MGSEVPDKLTPDDGRVEHHTLSIRGHTWHYIVGNPAQGAPVAGTVLLVHGWPDLGFGWRYQVPHLLSLGLRVVVPDMLGYGRTDAPEAAAEYSLRNIADDLAALAAHVTGPGARVILGGHDWGGAVVWRTALWRPELVEAVFSVCTPYAPPAGKDKEYLEPAKMVKVLPNFRYQLQLAGPEIEQRIVGRDKLRQLLSALYGGRGPNGEPGFTTANGAEFDNLDIIGPSPLLNEAEMDFYVDEYMRHGMHGPLNWYRTGRINFDDERTLVQRADAAPRIAAPSLMIMASRDSALPPSLAAHMDRHFDDLTKREVDASHWALWAPAAAETNKHIGEFVQRVLEKAKGSKSSL